MIDSSSLFQSKIGDDSRTFRAEFLYNSQLIECSVKSVTIYKGSCGTSEFSPGAVFCPYIEAVIDDCNEILEGKELELRIGIMTNDDLSNPLFDYITMGFFTVGKPMTNTNRTTFIAQGRIAAKLSDYLDTVYTPVTIGTIAQQIEDDTGVTVVFDSGIDLNTPVSSAYLENAESPGITYREALGIAAFVIGGYATETADGMIRVCKFGNTVTSQTSAEDMQAPPAFNEYDTQITGVKVVVSEASGETAEVSYSSGSPVNLQISNAYMTEDAFDQYANNLIGLTYRAGSVGMTLGDPRLEAWDVLRVVDGNGNSFVLPCMSIIHSFDGGLQSKIDAPALASVTKVEGSVQRAIRLASAAERAAARAIDGVKPELITGTHGSTATSSWTGTSTRLSSLENGTRIQYKLSSAGTENVTLNLTLKDGTQTGAVAIFYDNNTRLGTQYGAGAVVDLIYDASGTSPVWRVLNPYTNSSATTSYRLSVSGTCPDTICIGTEDELYVETEDGQIVIVEANDEWAETIPESFGGLYLWTRTVIAYADGSDAVIYAVVPASKDILGQTDQYYLSGSSSELVNGEWTIDIPEYIEDHYYWKRTVTFYSDGTESVSDPAYDGALNSVAELNESLDPEGVFNRLTDNGQLQGLYKDENTGDIYINANYIMSGAFKIVDDRGNVIFLADKTNRVFKWNMLYSALSENGFLELFRNSDDLTLDSAGLRIARTDANGNRDYDETTDINGAEIIFFGYDENGRSFHSLFAPRRLEMFGYNSSGEYHALRLFLDGEQDEGEERATGLYMDNLQVSTDTNTGTITKGASSTNITMGTTWTTQVRKWGKVVEAHWNFNARILTSATTALTVGTLPSGYRPSVTIYKLGIAQDGTRIIYTINTNGTITVQNVSGAAQSATTFFRDSVTFII